MKKFLVLFAVLLVLAASFVACNQSEIPENTTETNINGQTDRALLTIETLEEYDAFLETMPEDEEFITYDVLQEIGEFEHFVVLSLHIAGDYSRCLYSLRDDAGNKIGVYVNRMSEGDYIPEITVSEVADPTDLRRIDSNKVEYYEINGMVYRYIEGKLNYISWRTGEYQFTLSSDPWLSEFPVGEDTFVSKLLSQETAVTVVESINAKVASK